MREFILDALWLQVYSNNRLIVLYVGGGILNYLEDLAGNNLNRRFDRDLLADSTPVSTAKVLIREFEIGKK